MVWMPGKQLLKKGFSTGSEQLKFGETIYRKYIPGETEREKQQPQEETNTELIYRADPLTGLCELLELFGAILSRRDTPGACNVPVQIKQTILYQIQNRIQVIQANPLISIELKKALASAANDNTPYSETWLRRAEDAVRRELKKNSFRAEREKVWSGIEESLNVFPQATAQRVSVNNLLKEILYGNKKQDFYRIGQDFEKEQETIKESRRLTRQTVLLRYLKAQIRTPGAITFWNPELSEKKEQLSYKKKITYKQEFIREIEKQLLYYTRLTRKIKDTDIFERMLLYEMPQKPLTTDGELRERIFFSKRWERKDTLASEKSEPGNQYSDLNLRQNDKKYYYHQKRDYFPYSEFLTRNSRFYSSSKNIVNLSAQYNSNVNALILNNEQRIRKIKTEQGFVNGGVKNSYDILPVRSRRQFILHGEKRIGTISKLLGKKALLFQKLIDGKKEYNEQENRSWQSFFWNFPEKLWQECRPAVFHGNKQTLLGRLQMTRESAIWKLQNVREADDKNLKRDGYETYWQKNSGSRQNLQWSAVNDKEKMGRYLNSFLTRQPKVILSRKGNLSDLQGSRSRTGNQRMDWSPLTAGKTYLGIKLKQQKNQYRQVAVIENLSIRRLIWPDNKQCCILKIDSNGLLGKDKVTDKFKSELPGKDEAADKLKNGLPGKDEAADRIKSGLPGKDKAADRIKSGLPGKDKAADRIKSGLPGKDKAADRIKSGLPGKDKAADRIKSGLPGKDKAADRIKSGLPGKDKATDKFKNGLPGKDKITDRIKSRLLGKDKAADKLKNGLPGKDKITDRIKSRLLGKDKAADRIKSRLLGKDKAADRIKSRLIYKDKGTDKFQSRLVDKDKARDKLQSRLTDKDKATDRIKNELTDKDKATDRIKNELTDKDKATDKFQSRLVGKDEVTDKIKRIGRNESISRFKEISGNKRVETTHKLKQLPEWPLINNWCKKTIQAGYGIKITGAELIFYLYSRAAGQVENNSFNRNQLVNISPNVRDFKQPIEATLLFLNDDFIPENSKIRKSKKRELGYETQKNRELEYETRKNTEEIRQRRTSTAVFLNQVNRNYLKPYLDWLKVKIINYSPANNWMNKNEKAIEIIHTRESLFHSMIHKGIFLDKVFLNFKILHNWKIKNRDLKNKSFIKRVFDSSSHVSKNFITRIPEKESHEIKSAIIGNFKTRSYKTKDFIISFPKNRSIKDKNFVIRAINRSFEEENFIAKALINRNFKEENFIARTSINRNSKGRSLISGTPINRSFVNGNFEEEKLIARISINRNSEGRNFVSGILINKNFEQETLVSVMPINRNFESKPFVSKIFISRSFEDRNFITEIYENKSLGGKSPISEGSANRLSEVQNFQIKINHKELHPDHWILQTIPLRQLIQQNKRGFLPFNIGRDIYWQSKKISQISLTAREGREKPVLHMGLKSNRTFLQEIAVFCEITDLGLKHDLAAAGLKYSIIEPSNIFKSVKPEIFKINRENNRLRNVRTKPTHQNYFNILWSKEPKASESNRKSSGITNTAAKQIFSAWTYLNNNQTKKRKLLQKNIERDPIQAKIFQQNKRGFLYFYLGKNFGQRKEIKRWKEELYKLGLTAAAGGKKLIFPADRKASYASIIKQIAILYETIGYKWRQQDGSPLKNIEVNQITKGAGKLKFLTQQSSSLLIMKKKFPDNRQTSIEKEDVFGQNHLNSPFRKRVLLRNKIMFASAVYRKGKNPPLSFLPSGQEAETEAGLEEWQPKNQRQKSEREPVIFRMTPQPLQSRKEETEVLLEQRIQQKLEQMLGQKLEQMLNSRLTAINSDETEQAIPTAGAVKKENYFAEPFDTEPLDALEEETVYNKLYQRLERNLRLELRRTGR